MKKRLTVCIWAKLQRNFTLKLSYYIFLYSNHYQALVIKEATIAEQATDEPRAEPTTEKRHPTQGPLKNQWYVCFILV